MTPDPTTTTTIAGAAVHAASTGWGDTVWAVIVLPLVLAVGGGIWGLASRAGERRAATREVRRTATKDLFTAALDAVHEYQELPYRIRRRSDVNPMTPGELTSHASDVQVLLDKHVTRLEFENPEVGAAYRTLVTATRREAGTHMSDAWTQPRITADADMNLGNAYPRVEAEKAKEHCMSVMREHLNGAQSNSRLRWGRR